MNIREIRVEGFGALRDRTIGLEGPVTVFYGPNEAGKSTLLHLIRAVLFGFPPRGQGADRFEPPGGGAHGGTLTLETVQGERARVARRSAEAAGGRGRSPSGGIVSVTLADGAAGGEELLRELLGGVTGEQFKNLFAFTLTELQELRTLTSGELGGFLHSAGLGVRAAAVTEAERRLAQELDARFRPRGKNQGIGKLLAEADRLEADWRRSLAAAGRYNDLVEELDLVSAVISQGEEELRQARSRLAFMRSATGLRERWLRRVTAARELALLPARPDFPGDGVKRQDELLQELDRQQIRWTQLEARRPGLSERLRAFTDEDRKLLGARDKLEGLLERLGAYKNGFLLEAEWKIEIGRLEELLRSKLMELGHAVTEESLADMRITLQHHAEARQWKEQGEASDHQTRLLQTELDGLNRAQLEAEERVSERLWELETRMSDISRVLPAQDAREWAVRLPELARELRKDMREADGIKREMQYVEQRELEYMLQLQQQAQAAEAKAAPWDSSVQSLLGLAAWAAAVGSAAFYLLDREWLWAAAALVTLGGLGTLLVFLGRFRSESGRAQRGSSRGSRPYTAGASVLADSPYSEKRRELAERLEAATDRIARKLQGIPFRPEAAAAAGKLLRSGEWTPDPTDENLPDRLEHWASEMAKELREADRLEERWKEACRLAESVRLQRERVASGQAALERTRAAWLADWKQWLRQWGTGLELPPASAPELLDRLAQAQECNAGRKRMSAQLRSVTDERGSFEEDCRSLVGLIQAMEHETDAEELEIPHALQRLKQEMELAVDRRLRMEEAAAAMEELTLELEQARQALLQQQAKLELLWRQAGAEDVEELRRLGAELEARRQLAEEIRVLDEVLAAGAGAGRMEELDRLLARYGQEELAEEIARAEMEAEELLERLDQKKEARGQLTAERDKLLEGSEHGDRRERLEDMLTRFREEASQWAVYAMASGLLRKARETYERERQPGVLRQASAHFSRLTEGRYERIVAPMGEQRLLAVRADGEQVDSSRLSRGTAEQLYLSIRFALAGEMAARIPLPLIMDDIFVNFDRQRLEASVKELCLLADKHQILVFTCHPHVLEAMQAAMPRMQVVAL